MCFGTQSTHPQVDALCEELEAAVLLTVDDTSLDGGDAMHRHLWQPRQQHMQREVQVGAVLAGGGVHLDAVPRDHPGFATQEYITLMPHN